MGCTGSKHKDGGVASPRNDKRDGNPNNKNKAVAANDGAGKKNEKKQQAQDDGGGIGAFAPSTALAQQYAAYIRDVRQAGIEAGLMRPVARPYQRELKSILANIEKRPPQGGVGADRDDEEEMEEDINPDEPIEDTNHKANKQKGKRSAKTNAVKTEPEVPLLEAHKPPASVTVFQCRPLPGLPVIARGQYGQVLLATMSLVHGEFSEELQPQRPRGVADHVGSSAAPSVPESPLLGNKAHAANGGSTRHLRGVYEERHFLIAMKEIPVLSSHPQAAVLTQLKKQVQRWSRLSAYSPRVLRCLQMECVYGPAKEGAQEEGKDAQPPLLHLPAPGATFHDVDGVVRPDPPATADSSFAGMSASPSDYGSFAGGGKKGLFGRRKRNDAKGGGDTAAGEESARGPLTKIRLYMEFAKYGTLRSFQLREMQEKFHRTRLHELTARALMREVLLALVDIHDQGMLQYDLSAKNIFLLRPIKSVYRTYFPAYISDLPVGHILRVPPRVFHEAMCLMDPTLTLAQQQQLAQQQLHEGGLPLSCTHGGGASASAVAQDGRLSSQQRQSGGAQSPNTRSSQAQQYPNRQGIEAASPVVSAALHNLALQHNLSMVALPPSDLQHTGQDLALLPTQQEHASSAHPHSSQSTVTHANGSEPQDAAAAAGSAPSASGGGGGSGAAGNGLTGLASSPEGGGGGGIVDPNSPYLAYTISRNTSYFPADGPGTASTGDIVANSSVVYNSLLRGEQKWVKDDFREYMQEHGYEDCVSLPAPSPHDGFRDYGLAAAVTKLTVKQELAPVHECMQVLPLRDAPDGGIAMVCHNRYNHPVRQQLQQPPAAKDFASNEGSLAGAGGPLSDGGSVGNFTIQTNQRDVIEVGDMSLARTHFDPSTEGPPQLLPANANPTGYVLPSCVSSGAWGAYQNPTASPTGAESLNDCLTVASSHRSPNAGKLSATHAHSQGGQRHSSSGGTSGVLRGDDSFRGSLVRLNHVAAIRRALALSNHCIRVSDVPVHRFITVTHAAPEVVQRKEFTKASDVFAFAMTFIELVSDDGAIMEECNPSNLAKPRTRKEKDEYDSLLTANLNKWYNSRIDALNRNRDAVAAEQQLPDSIQPPRPPVVVRIPEHLSDECKNMLKWCLQTEPSKRPTVLELLSSKYFLLGDWISGEDGPGVFGTNLTAGTASGRKVQYPEKPWDEAGDAGAAHGRSNELLAQAAGFPVIPDRLIAKSFSPSSALKYAPHGAAVRR